MLDIRWMRENRAALGEAMQKLNAEDAPWEQALELDLRRRQILTQVETLRAELNSGSRNIGALFREKRTAEANALKANMGAIGSDIESSILTTSLLLRAGVKDLWAKAVSEPHALILEQLGVAPLIMRKRVEEALDLLGIAALRHRDVTGEGQHVDIALLDSLLFQCNGLLTMGGGRPNGNPGTI